MEPEDALTWINPHTSIEEAEIYRADEIDPDRTIGLVEGGPGGKPANPNNEGKHLLVPISESALPTASSL
ncbi:hypothetical protein C8R31_10650 [Nitrosospira sp. Nsp2]|uniref:hypothetical protein n=1 Tax=Nitrosospira sp. Nsp2 TaxID=136548 RepID=UPI000D2F8325|nr:hypothetical protein [Nitrosospira sp. Nsp2]PTR14378.1 hypothetical protein C8R31_10650 [Nitrosospira sp. Nsp2]